MTEGTGSAKEVRTDLDAKPEGVPAVPRRAGRDGSHGHLWRLPDGTGLHAPPGVLTRHPDGTVCCHLCGRWFRALGSHVRSHGYTAAKYREVLGLSKTRPLSSLELSTSIAERQRRAYRTSEEIRRRFEPGQQLARSGQLAEKARAAGRDLRLETAIAQLDALTAGRHTQESRRHEDLRVRLEAIGAPSLNEYLCRAYRFGASLDQLARHLGLGHGQLRAAMTAADIALRPTGVNTAAGKRSRADTADQVAAARVGTEDLVAWLTERRAAGATLTELATAVGHSSHWVRWRLERAPDERAPDEGAPTSPGLPAVGAERHRSAHTELNGHPGPSLGDS